MRYCLTAISALSTVLIGWFVITAAASDVGQVCAAGHVWELDPGKEPALAYEATFAVKFAAANKILFGYEDASRFEILHAVKPDEVSIEFFEWVGKQEELMILSAPVRWSKWKAPEYTAQTVHRTGTLKSESSCHHDPAVEYIAFIPEEHESIESTPFLVISDSIKAAQ